MSSQDSASVQRQIIKDLDVRPPFRDREDTLAEIRMRIAFLKQTLRNSGCKSYILGISGGVDSLVAGLLAQQAVMELRQEADNNSYAFIAMRLPYKQQADEEEATAAVACIKPDHLETVNIGASVDALVMETRVLQKLSPGHRDFAIGNIKARIRMTAQYAVANARHGLVIGTDHAAEAVMGFFTKYGDGACDLTPLSGLYKTHIRAMASCLGVPENLVNKIPTADLEDLRPGRPDEDAYGVTYAEIDTFLQGLPVSDRAFETITSAYRKSAHKRKLPLAFSRSK